MSARPEYVRIATVATMYDCTEAAVRKWISKGALPAVRLGARALRVRPRDVEKLMTPVEHRGEK